MEWSTCELATLKDLRHAVEQVFAVPTNGDDRRSTMFEAGCDNAFVRQFDHGGPTSTVGVESAVVVERRVTRGFTTTGNSAGVASANGPYPPRWYFTTHLRTMLALAPCARATPASDAPGCRHSRMIASFSARGQRRRSRRLAAIDPPSFSSGSRAIGVRLFTSGRHVGAGQSVNSRWRSPDAYRSS
jgi:hypothetical protein